MKLDEKTGLPEFEGHEFACDCPKQLQGEHWDFCKGVETADTATAALHEWLRGQPVVFGLYHDGTFWCGTDKSPTLDTHTAHLIGIRKLGVGDE